MLNLFCKGKPEGDKMSRNDDFSFEIREHIGVIGTYSTGWKKEVNLVAWNGNQPKIDIRDWDPGHEHMSRGLTLHGDEAKNMVRLLSRYLNGEREDKNQNDPG